MKTAFRKSFLRDLKKIKSKTLLERIQELIEQVESATELQQVPALKKMAGTTAFYRIRVGDYRIGVVVEQDSVEFVRCLPRRDLYRFFP